jgi:hypothetical protein
MPSKLNLRFTLGGLMLFVTGVAVGFAYLRLNWTKAPGGMMACFGSWLVIGMFGECWRRWRMRSNIASRSVDAQWGWSLQTAAPAGIAGLILIAALMDAARRSYWLDVEDRDFSSSLATIALTESIFYFAVVCAYRLKTVTLLPRSSPTPSQLVIDFVLWAFGGFWLMAVALIPTLLTALSHIAIRGVEVFQPTRWAGRPLYPANLHIELTHSFVTRGIVAYLLLTIFAACGIGLARTWHRSPQVRWALTVVGLIGLIPLLFLVYWWRTIGLPTISPFLAEATFRQPIWNIALGATVIVAASTAIAIVAVRKQSAAKTTSTGEAATLIHEKPLVMIFFLVAAIWLFLTDVWFSSWALNTWKWPRWMAIPTDFAWDRLTQPEQIMKLAAMLAVAYQLLRTLKGQSVVETDWLIPPGKFAAVLIATSLVLLLAMPVANWLGLALVLQSSMP